MPNRIVREGILSSERVCSLGWQEEVFYRRLMSVVDDYGRFEASPNLLRSKCFPIQVDRIREADILRWMAACQTAELIVLYKGVHNGREKQFLQITEFRQRQRVPSKYPAPDDGQMTVICPSNARLGVVKGVVKDVNGQDKLDREREEQQLVSHSEELYRLYPRKKAKPVALESIRKALGKVAFEDLKKAVQKFAASSQGKEVRYIPHPATWFNQERWTDSGDEDSLLPQRDLSDLSEKEREALFSDDDDPPELEVPA